MYCSDHHFELTIYCNSHQALFCAQCILHEPEANKHMYHDHFVSFIVIVDFSMIIILYVIYLF